MRRIGSPFVVASAVAVALCFFGGCKGEGAEQGVATTGPPKGSVKFPTPEERAAKQKAARAKGIQPDPKGGPPAGVKGG